MKVAPTNANPDTANASVKGAWLCRRNDGAAPVDCWGGGVPDEDAEGDVPEVVFPEGDIPIGDGNPIGVGDGIVPAGVLMRRPLDSNELGMGVSPGGMAIEPSDTMDVTPPLHC
jgi:hypothetical protein